MDLVGAGAAFAKWQGRVEVGRSWWLCVSEGIAAVRQQVSRGNLREKEIGVGRQREAELSRVQQRPLSSPIIRPPSSNELE